MIRNLILVAFILTSIDALSQVSITTRKKHYNIDDHALAIQGYDPVSYFQGDDPKKGNPDINYNYKGINYRFSSVENRSRFINNPEQYEPTYGGWCAYAMGENGEKVKIDPETFKILDGKLYLFYNFFFDNTLKDWNKNEGNLKSQADKNWATKINQQ